MTNRRTECQAIILAGGNSRRAGEPKGLRDYKGRPWIEHIARCYLAVSRPPVLVVWNPDAPLAGGLAPGEARFIVPPRVTSGPLESLQLALAAGESDCYLATPVDVPPPGMETLAFLLDHARCGAAVKPTVGGKGGHPILLNASAVSEIRGADPCSTRLDELACIREAMRLEVADPRVVMNLNTPEAWQQFLAEG